MTSDASLNKASLELDKLILTTQDDLEDSIGRGVEDAATIPRLPFRAKELRKEASILSRCLIVVVDTDRAWNYQAPY